MKLSRMIYWPDTFQRKFLLITIVIAVFMTTMTVQGKKKRLKTLLASQRNQGVPSDVQTRSKFSHEKETMKKMKNRQKRQSEHDYEYYYYPHPIFGASEGDGHRGSRDPVGVLPPGESYNYYEETQHQVDYSSYSTNSKNNENSGTDNSNGNDGGGSNTNDDSYNDSSVGDTDNEVKNETMGVTDTPIVNSGVVNYVTTAGSLQHDESSSSHEFRTITTTELMETLNDTSTLSTPSSRSLAQLDNENNTHVQTIESGTASVTTTDKPTTLTGNNSYVSNDKNNSDKISESSTSIIANLTLLPTEPTQYSLSNNTISLESTTMIGIQNFTSSKVYEETTPFNVSLVEERQTSTTVIRMNNTTSQVTGTYEKDNVKSDTTNIGNRVDSLTGEPLLNLTDIDSTLTTTGDRVAETATITNLDRGEFITASTYDGSGDNIQERFISVSTESKQIHGSVTEPVPCDCQGSDVFKYMMAEIEELKKKYTEVIDKLTEDNQIMNTKMDDMQKQFEGSKQRIDDVQVNITEQVMDAREDLGSVMGIIETNLLDTLNNISKREQRDQQKQVNGTDTTKLGMTDLSNCKYVTMNNHSTALDKTTYTDWCPHPDETGKLWKVQTAYCSTYGGTRSIIEQLETANVRQYRCVCDGQLMLQNDSRYCELHMWLCP